VRKKGRGSDERGDNGVEGGGREKRKERKQGCNGGS